MCVCVYVCVCVCMYICIYECVGSYILPCNFRNKNAFRQKICWLLEPFGFAIICCSLFMIVFLSLTCRSPS